MTLVDAGRQVINFLQMHVRMCDDRNEEHLFDGLSIRDECIESEEREIVGFKHSRGSLGELSW